MIYRRHTGFDDHQVGLLELVASYWVCAILGDVFEDEATLIDFPRLHGDNWLLRGFARECTEEHGGISADKVEFGVQRSSVVCPC